ncbi:MAG: GNAT family N-acetyltransferase [Bacillota bacterium]
MNVRAVQAGTGGADRSQWLALEERALTAYGLVRRALPDPLEPDGLWLRLGAEEGGRMVAALSVRVEGDLATLQPFHPLVDPEATTLDEAASALWREAQRRLTEWGVLEAVATLRYPPDRRSSVEPLTAWFRRSGLDVTERLVMARPLDFSDVAAARRNEPPGISFATWAGRNEEVAGLFRQVFEGREEAAARGLAEGDRGRRPLETMSGRRGAFDAERTALALEDGRPIGFAAVTLHPEDALLADLGVLPADRHRGLGSALLGRAYEAALRAGRRRLSLVVEAEDRAARGFFERRGFTALTEVGWGRWTPARPDTPPLAVVTGGTGHIGRDLVRLLLSRGWRVRCLVGDPPSPEVAALVGAGVEPWPGGLLDPASLRGLLDGATDAYHLAETEQGDPADLRRLNVDGAVNVAREASGGSVRALVIASSAAVYGDTGQDLVNEEARRKPGTAYGRSKAALEEALRTLADEAGGLPVRFARLGTVYGPGSPALPVEEIRHGRFRLIGNGDNWGSYIHRDDVARALFWVARRGRDGEAYNLCDDRPTKVGRFYELAAEKLGAPHLDYISSGAARVLVPLAGVAGRLGGRRPKASVDTVKAMTASVRMSNARLRKELGAALTCPTVDVGLARTIAEGGPDHADRS